MSITPNKKVYIFVREQLYNCYGVRVIVNQIKKTIKESEIIFSLKNVPDGSIVIPYGVLESMELIKYRRLPLYTSLLVDAFSLGEISDFKRFITKRYIPLKFSLLCLPRFLKHLYYEFLIFRKFKKVILVSYYDKTYYQKLHFDDLAKSKIVIVPNGIVLPSNREGYQRSQDKIFRVGCLSLWSGVEVFYTLKYFINEIWSKLPMPDVKLIIAGRCISEEMRLYLSKYNNIVILGEVEKLEDFYDNIDASLITMFKKCGIINRVLDGFSYKVPVISRSESMLAFKDLPDCYYGYKDVESFRQAVERIKNNREEARLKVEQAYSYVRDYHNWDKNYINIENLFAK